MFIIVFVLTFFTYYRLSVEYHDTTTTASTREMGTAGWKPTGQQAPPPPSPQERDGGGFSPSLFRRPLPCSKRETEGGFSSFLRHHPPPSPILSTNDHYHPSITSNVRRGLVLSTTSHCHSVASNMSGGARLAHRQPPPPLCRLKREEGLVLSTTCHHCPSVASNVRRGFISSTTSTTTPPLPQT